MMNQNMPNVNEYPQAMPANLPNENVPNANEYPQAMPSKAIKQPQKPNHNMVKEPKGMHEKMAKKEIMNYEFTLRDLGLYLDTHPTDANALADYNRIVRKRDLAVKNYETLFGPYTVGTSEVLGGRWTWINSPWPWEGECY